MKKVLGKRERMRERLKGEVLAALKKLKNSKDPEQAHLQADALLLILIGDDEIADAYGEVTRYYS